MFMRSGVGREPPLHRIASHRIASHRIAPHRIHLTPPTTNEYFRDRNYHRTASSYCFGLLTMLLFVLGECVVSTDWQSYYTQAGFIFGPCTNMNNQDGQKMTPEADQQCLFSSVRCFF